MPSDREMQEQEDAEEGLVRYRYRAVIEYSVAYGAEEMPEDADEELWASGSALQKAIEHGAAGARIEPDIDAITVEKVE